MREYALHEAEHREASWPFGIFGRLARNLWRRRTLHRLALLEDHVLVDIGLSRHDVMMAMRLPLSVDPIYEIERRARRRKPRGIRTS
jgi:uncharacterized protein YjiS (DUF1127 family)